MGVKGLWSLLNPVARPVQIESMEGKRMAIDSSIWLYQFQATMRDKDGRVLVNAHVLGFLRRINKLLFHGIKPVFVFDGGAPVLKRNTIAERKRRKAGAAANHARMAERLFAAQMRREAVKVAQTAKDQEAARQEAEAASAAARYNDDEGDQIAEGAVYLEDLEGRPGFAQPRPPPAEASTSRRPATPPPDPREERRKKFRKHDPYRLPEASMPTVSTEEKPDARLATEEELKQFIDEVHPEDIDIESPEFRALPTEVQYEIVGDMRVRSRQTSHRRLADMLRAAPTALDFSMAQIKNLSQRNALTQQLLTVTDMVGQAHLTIPVRIAAERNREYVLVKRDEASGGGWALGIREGSKEKPIEVDKDVKPAKREDDSDYSDSEYDSSDVEEIAAPPAPPSRQTTDPDLKEHRRREVLEAIAARYAPQKAARPSLDIEPRAFGMAKRPGAAPLFDSADDDDDRAIVPSANDEALALALQQEELGSDEDEADEDLARALAMSRREAEGTEDKPETVASIASPKSAVSEDSMEEVSLEPSRVPTPQNLSQGQTPIQVDDGDDDDLIEVEGPLAPFTLPTSTKPPPTTQKNAPLPALPAAKEPKSQLNEIMRNDHQSGASSSQLTHVLDTAEALQEVDKRLEDAKASDREATKPEVEKVLAKKNHSRAEAGLKTIKTITQDVEDIKEVIAIDNSGSSRLTEAAVQQLPSSVKPQASVPPITPSAQSGDPRQTPGPAVAASRRDASQPTPPTRPIVQRQLSRVSSQHVSPGPRSRASSLRSGSKTPAREEEPEDPDNLTNALLGVRPTRPVDRHSYMEMAEESVPSSYQGSAHGDEEMHDAEAEDEEEMHDAEAEDEEDEPIPWSRSPSPVARPPLQPAQSGETIPSEVEDEEEDMAPAEMVAEQDDYARFMASIRNRDLNEVRTEIDDEIRVLHNQNKLAMRDSDEITHAMVAQIQTLLRHYGIPYITAPMEAEAQCAKLAELGLVDGIITDDSDVFLFGGIQCFKNIFNDAKYAECFLSSDIERELSLTRERLISLAYLLGSDYTIGLPGVGPVVALELLSNFPGPTGLDEFKVWWTKVQRGQDTESDTNTKWKKSFKKRFAPTILLTAEWPNHLVREAYKYPTTDESEEPFHWGFPKLSALRAYLHEELSWSISKVDDELTPIVQRIARRGKVGALNKQATLDPFFDLSAGQGNYAPRRRATANVSKRLLAVIKDFREAEARVVGGPEPEWNEMMKDLDAEDPKGKGTGKRRQSQSQVTEDGFSEKPKKPRRKKSDSAITSTKDDGEENVGEDKPVKKRGRPRRDTASTASVPDVGGTVGNGSLPSTSTPTKDEVDLVASPQIAIPKNGLRGSATGVVGAGKRKKAALTAWRNSTKSKDLGPT